MKKININFIEKVKTENFEKFNFNDQEITGFENEYVITKEKYDKIKKKIEKILKEIKKIELSERIEIIKINSDIYLNDPIEKEELDKQFSKSDFLNSLKDFETKLEQIEKKILENQRIFSKLKNNSYFRLLSYDYPKDLSHSKNIYHSIFEKIR
jgi:hypothetical protein